MSEKLKIVYRPLQELSPYAHNARTHSPEQVAQLVESIKQFGWTNPVLIDEKGEIIAGHGRVMAAEMLKMDSVPVIVLSGLTDEQKKAYRLADNRLPMNAGWDEDLLTQLTRFTTTRTGSTVYSRSHRRCSIRAYLTAWSTASLSSMQCLSASISTLIRMITVSGVMQAFRPPILRCADLSKSFLTSM